MANLIDSVDPRDDAFSGLGDSMLALGRPQTPEEYRAQVDGINQLVSRAVQTGGLGLARGFDAVGSGLRQGAEAVGEGLQAITPSQDTLHRIFMGLEAAGAAGQGRTPLFMEMRKMESDQAMKRMTLAQQLEAQKETVRQNQWEDVFKVLNNSNLSPPQAESILKGMAKTNPQAASAARSVNAKMLGDFHALKDHLPMKPEEYAEGLQSGQITWDHVAADLDIARTEKKTLAQENAIQRKTQGLLTKFRENPDQMTDTELDLVDKHFKTQEERQLKIKDLRDKVGQQQIMNPLEQQKARQELARGNAPIVSPPVTTPSGEHLNFVTDPATGKRTEYQGVPQSLTKTQDMNASAQEKVIEARAVLEQIASLDKSFQESYVGPLDNLAAWAKETAPGIFGPISGQEEKFRKGLNTVVTNARRIDAGTAQSVQELAQLAKTYPDLKQHESVFKPAIEAMRERITAGLKARSRLAAEIAAGRQKPFSLSERAAQLAITVSAPGFAKDAEDAKAIARQILSEEMKLGIVKGD